MFWAYLQLPPSPPSASPQLGPRRHPLICNVASLQRARQHDQPLRVARSQRAPTTRLRTRLGPQTGSGGLAAHVVSPLAEGGLQPPAPISGLDDQQGWAPVGSRQRGCEVLWLSQLVRLAPSRLFAMFMHELKHVRAAAAWAARHLCCVAAGVSIPRLTLVGA